MPDGIALAVAAVDTQKLVVEGLTGLHHTARLHLVQYYERLEYFLLVDREQERHDTALGRLIHVFVA